MIRAIGYTLLLTVAIGLPTSLAGCRARPGLVAESSVHTPNRTVVSTGSGNVGSTGSSLGETAQPVPDAKPTADPPADSEPVSLGKLTPVTPREILKSAGAVFEQDKHGRTIGVDLTAAHISAEVTSAVAELTELQWVDMRAARITDADLAVIATLPRLELLALGKTLVTDAGMKHLQHQQDLRFLSLDGTAVTDKGLLTLAGLPRLEGISLSETSVSREAAAVFQKQTPGCKVMLDANAPEAMPKRPPAPPEATPGESTSYTEELWDLHSAAEPSPFPRTAESFPVIEDSTALGIDATGRRLSELLQRRLLDDEVLRALSQHLMAQRSYTKAAKALEALVAEQPDDHQARFDLGVALARTGRFEAAQPHLAAVVGDATAYYNLGIIAHELNRPDRSELYLTKAIDVAPDFVQAQQWLQRVRNATDVVPASHAPHRVDQQDLVDLLMSEMGAAGAVVAPNRSATGIEIIPASRRMDASADAAER